MALNKAKVFTITSVKGGVGKTTTVLNLAGIYSRMNKKVLVWSCCVMTFFSACQQAELENQKSDDWRMSIVASIGSPKDASNSRYAGDDPMQVEFETSDCYDIIKMR